MNNLKQKLTHTGTASTTGSTLSSTTGSTMSSSTGTHSDLGHPTGAHHTGLLGKAEGLLHHKHHGTTTTGTTGSISGSNCACVPAPTVQGAETRMHAPVVNETIKQNERDIIQPVVHREIQQTEVHQVTQPIVEQQIKPTIVHQREVRVPEVREIVKGSTEIRPMATLHGSTVVERAGVERVVQPTIVEEVVRPRIIEEIQPVVHRTVVEPHIVRETQHIYEREVRAPVYIQETRAPLVQGAQTSSCGCPPGQVPVAIPSTGMSSASSGSYLSSATNVGTTGSQYDDFDFNYHHGHRKNQGMTGTTGYASNASTGSMLSGSTPATGSTFASSAPTTGSTFASAPTTGSTFASTTPATSESHSGGLLGKLLHHGQHGAPASGTNLDGTYKTR